MGRFSLKFKLLRGYQFTEEETITYTLPSWTSDGMLTTTPGYGTYTIYTPDFSTTGSGTIKTTNLPTYTTNTTGGLIMNSSSISTTSGTITTGNFIGYSSSSLHRA